MGHDAARITAADFVTPPELSHLSLARHPAGRIGGVRMELARAAGKEKAPRTRGVPRGPKRPSRG